MKFLFNEAYQCLVFGKCQQAILIKLFSFLSAKKALCDLALQKLLNEDRTCVTKI